MRIVIAVAVTQRGTRIVRVKQSDDMTSAPAVIAGALFSAATVILMDTAHRMRVTVEIQVGVPAGPQGFVGTAQEQPLGLHVIAIGLDVEQHVARQHHGVEALAPG